MGGGGKETWIVTDTGLPIWTGLGTAVTVTAFPIPSMKEKRKSSRAKSFCIISSLFMVSS